MTYSTGQWTWNDGSSQLTEVYNSNGRLEQTRDADGNTRSYSYTTIGNQELLTQIQDASGQTIRFEYTDNPLSTSTQRNLQSIQTQSTKAVVREGESWSDLALRLYGSATVASALQTQQSNVTLRTGLELTGLATTLSDGGSTYELWISRVQYGYDHQDRLVQVIVDLTPEDKNFTLVDRDGDTLYDSVNGHTYVTTYTYDGNSHRIASITQGDGTSISFNYVEGDPGDWWLQSYTDGNGKTTTFDYSLAPLTTSTAPPAPPSGAVLLNNAFADSTLTGWTVVDEGTTSAPSGWVANNGVVTQNSNIYSGTLSASDLIKPGSYLRYNSGNAWTDYTVEVDIRSGDNDGMGIMFRAQDNNNYYRFGWNESNPYRRIVKKQNGVFTQIIGDTVPFTQNTTYHLSITVQGNRIRLSIDGTEIFNVVDNTPIAAGSVALYTFANTPTVFSGLRVSEILTANVAPYVNRAIDPQSALVDQPFNLTLAADTFADPNAGDSLTYSAQLADGKPLPTWLSFDANTLTFSGTPTAAVAQDNRIQITATDSGGLSATADLQLTVQTGASGSLLLSDPFASGSFTGWSIVDEGTTSDPSNWTISNGVLAQNSNIYSGLSTLQTPGSYVLYDGGTAWTDYEVGVDLMSGDNDAMGFMFRVQDSNNYYRFSWDQSRNYRRIVKVENGTFTVLAEDSITYNQNQAYRLNVAVTGDHIVLSIDDTEIFNVFDDTPITSGSIAPFTSGNTPTWFSNIQVRDTAGAQTRAGVPLVDGTAYVTTVTDATGAQVRYQMNDQNHLSSRETLSRTGQLIENQEYFYTAAGDLYQTRDGNNTVNYRYDDNGNLLQRQDAEGNTVTYTYTPENRLQTETQYAQVDTNLQNDINEAGQAQTTRYIYDGEGHLRITLSPQGRVTENDYSATGLLTRTRVFTHDSYNVSGLTQDQVPTLAQLTAWTTDPARDLSKTQLSEFDYDFRGNLIASSTYAQVNVSGNGEPAGKATTHFIYDQAGNLIQSIDPRGVASATLADHLTEFQYDGLSRLLQTTAARDAQEITNNVTPNITTAAYDDENNRVHSVAANGLMTTNYYDTAGQLSRTDSTPLWEQDFSVDASGLVGSGLNNPAHMEVRDGRLVTKTFDNPTGLWPNLRGAIHQFSDGIDFRMEVTTGATSSGRYLMAGIDNNRSTADNLFRRHYARFIGNGLYVHYRRADLSYQIDYLGAIQDNTTYIVELETDNSGTTLYVYEKGKSRASGWVNHQTLTDYGTVNSRLYTYGTLGYPVSEMYVDNMSEHQTLSSTQYLYDAEGKLRISQNSTGERQHLIYDDADRPVAVIDANGTIVETVYDAGGNVVKTIDYATALTPTQLALLSNADGSPADITLQQLGLNHTTSGAQDQLLDRVTRNIYDKANRLVMTFQADEYVTTPEGLKEQGYVSQLIYNGLGQVSKTIAYNNPIQILHSTETVVPADIEVLLTRDIEHDRINRNYYDNNGQLIATLDGEGYLTQLQYNAAGQLVHTHGHAAQYSGDINTDPANLVALIASVGTHADDQHHYTLYNARGQKVGAVDAEGYLTEYVYDAAGNLETEYRYAGLAKPVTLTSTLANVRPDAVPVYDANNRIISDRITSYTYNARNQLATSTNPEGVTTQFTYDSVGNLIEETRSVGGLDQNLARTRVSQYDLQGRLIRTLAAQGKQALDALVSPTQAQIDALWAEYGESYAYDSEGRRTSVTDQWGNTSYFYYNEDGQLRYSVNAEGEVKETIYNNYGEITETIAYVNRLSAAALNTVTAASGGLLNSLILANIQPLAHEADQHNKQSYNLRGQIKSALDGNTYRSEFQYNAFGEVETQKQQLKDPGSALTNANSVQSTHRYDRRGLLTDSYRDSALGGLNLHNNTQYDAFGRVDTSTDAKGQLTNVTYDKLGRVIQITEPGNITRITSYDAFGRVLTQQNALQNMTQYSYNDTENSFSVVTPEGIETKTTLNAHGQTFQIKQDVGGEDIITQYDYDLNGNLTQVTEAQGMPDQIVSQTNQYDNGTEHNRLYETTDANNNVVRYQYDGANRLQTRTVDPNGLNIVTQFEYDGIGRTVRVIEAFGSVDARTTETVFDANGQVKETIVDPDGLRLVTRFTYDGQGNTLTVVTGLSQSYNAGTGLYTDISTDASLTRYEYDKLGRLKKQIVDPAGTPYSSAVPLSITTEYHYDENSNVVAIVDANGNITRNIYDEHDRLIYKVDAEGGVQHSEYNAEGQQIHTVRYANPLNNIDSLALIVNTTDISITPKPSQDQETHYVYDTDQRLRYSIDSLGYVTETQFNNLGQVERVLEYAQAITLPAQITETTITQRLSTTDPENRETLNIYDKLGRVKETIVDPQGLRLITRYSYDGTGNVQSREEGLSSQRNGSGFIPDGNGGYLDDRTDVVRTEYTYDALGRKETQIVDPDMGEIGVEYLKITNSYYYDRRGNQITAVDGEGNATRAIYDADNRLIYSVDAEGGVTHNEYDNAGNLTRGISYATAISTSGFPAVQQALVEADLIINPNANTDKDTRYYYDNNQRLIFTLSMEKAGAAILQENLYDARGNVEATIEYGARVESADFAAMDVTAIRNVITQMNLANVEHRITTYQYDANNRMIAETDALGTVTEYTYDAFGNVLASNEHGITSQERVSRQSPRIVYNNSGSGAMAWVEYVSGVANVYSKVYDSVTGWSARQFMYSGLNRYELEIDQAGNVYILIAGYNAVSKLADDALFLYTAETGEWSKDPVQVTTGAAHLPEIQSFSNGDVLFTWWQGSSLYSRVYRLASGWSGNAELLYSGVGPSGFMSAGSKDEFVLAFTEVVEVSDPYDPYNLTLEYSLKTLRYTTSSGWQHTPDLLDTSDYVGIVSLDVSENGKSVMLWVSPYNTKLGQSTNGVWSIDSLGEIVSSAISINANGDSVLAWVDIVVIGGEAERQLKVQTVLANGTRLNPVIVTTGRIPLDYMKAHIRDNGEIFLAWKEGSKIYSRWYDPQTSSWGSEKTESTVGNTIYEIIEGGGNLHLKFGFSSIYYGELNGIYMSTTPTSALANSTDVGLNRQSRNIYDKANRLVYNINSLGYVKAYRYDDNGNVSATVEYGANYPYPFDLDNNANAKADLDAFFQTNTSNNDRYALNVQDKAGRLSYNIDAMGYVTHSIYDNNGRLFRNIRHNDALNPSTLTALQQVSVVTGTQVKAALLQRVSVSAGKDQVTEFRYDSAGRLYEKVSALGSPEQYSELYGYDANGNMVQKTDGNGSVSHKRYDALGRVLVAVNGEGYAESFKYDALGDVVEHRNHVEKTGGLLSIRNTAPFVSPYVGVYSQPFWDGSAWVGSLQIALDWGIPFVGVADFSITYEGRDAFGNTQIRSQQFYGITVLDGAAVLPITINTSNPYFLANINSILDVNVNITNLSIYPEGEFKYRPEGGQSSYLSKNVTVYNNEYVLEGYDFAPGIYEYKLTHQYKIYSGKFLVENGTITFFPVELTVDNDPVSGDIVEKFTFDALGQVVTRQDPEIVNSNNQVLPGPITKYNYDVFGNQTDTIEAYGTADYRVTRREFDILGQVVEESFAFNEPEQSTSRFEYDAFGNQIRVYDPRVHALINSNSEWALQQRYELGFTVPNSGTYVVGPNDTWETVALVMYGDTGVADELKAKFNTTLTPGSLLSGFQTEVDSNTGASFSLRPTRAKYAGDSRNGNVSELTETEIEKLSSEYTFEQRFDSLNRKTAAYEPNGANTVTDYNAFGNIVKIKDPNGAFSVVYYDNLGRESLRIDPRGYATETTYDAHSNVVETIAYANTAVEVGRTYFYASPNIKPQIVDAAPSYGVYILRDPIKDQHNYADYDINNRKVSTTDAEGYSEYYKYDAVGNQIERTDKNGNIFQYEYDAVGNKIVDKAVGFNSRSVRSDAEVLEQYDVYNYQTISLGNGKVMALYQLGSGAGGVRTQLYTPGIGWENVGGFGSIAQRPTMDVNVSVFNNGNVLAVWRGTGYSYSRIYKLGEGWQDLQFLTEYETRDVSLTQFGDEFIAALRTSTGLELYKCDQNGIWTDFGTIGYQLGNGEAVSDVKVLADSYGTAMVIWGITNNNVSDITYKYSYFNSSQWTRPATLANTKNEFPFGSQLAAKVDHSGNYYLLAKALNADLVSYDLVLHKFGALSKSWESFTLVEQQSIYNSTDSVKLAVDFDGRVAVLWQNYDSVNSIYDNTINVYDRNMVLESSELMLSSSLHSVEIDLANNGNEGFALAFIKETSQGQMLANYYNLPGEGWRYFHAPIEVAAYETHEGAKISVNDTGKVYALWKTRAGQNRRLSVASTGTIDDAKYKYDAVGNLVEKQDGLITFGDSRSTFYKYDKSGNVVGEVLPAVASFNKTVRNTYAEFSSVIDRGLKATFSATRSSIFGATIASIDATITWSKMKRLGNSNMKIDWYQNGTLLGTKQFVANTDNNQISFSTVTGDVFNSVTPFSIVLSKEIINGSTSSFEEISRLNSYYSWSGSQPYRAVHSKPTTENLRISNVPYGTEHIQFRHWDSSALNLAKDLLFTKNADGSFVASFDEYEVNEFNVSELEEGIHGYVAEYFSSSLSSLGRVQGEFEVIGDDLIFRNVVNKESLSNTWLFPTKTQNYDLHNNLIREVDGNGNTFYSYYDKMGKKVASVDGEGYVRRYKYDPIGNMVEYRVYDTPISYTSESELWDLLKDSNADVWGVGEYRSTGFYYDASNRLVKVSSQYAWQHEMEGDSGLDKAVEQKSYDRNGNLTVETDAKGGKVYHFYDESGNRRATVNQEKSVIYWDYDGFGNVREMKQYATSINYISEYRRYQEIKTIMERSFTSPEDRVSEYAYNRRNQLLSETYIDLEVAQATSPGSIHIDNISGWSPEEKLDLLGHNVYTGSGTGFEYYQSTTSKPVIATSITGETYGVWTDQYNIYLAKYDVTTNTWAEAEVVHHSSVTLKDAEIYFDSEQNLLLFWEEFHPTEGKIKQKVRNVDGSWGLDSVIGISPIAVGGIKNYKSYDVELSDNGDMHLAWVTSSNQIRLRFKAAGEESWGTLVALHATGEKIKFLDLKSDGKGSIVVVYAMDSNLGGDRIFYMKNTATGWSGGAVPNVDPAYATIMSVDMNKSGQLVLVWKENVGGIDYLKLNRFDFSTNQWLQLINITESPDINYLLAGGQVKITENGEIIVVYGKNYTWEGDPVTNYYGYGVFAARGQFNDAALELSEDLLRGDDGNGFHREVRDVRDVGFSEKESGEILITWLQNQAITRNTLNVAANYEVRSKMFSAYYNPNDTVNLWRIDDAPFSESENNSDVTTEYALRNSTTLLGDGTFLTISANGTLSDRFEIYSSRYVGDASGNEFRLGRQLQNVVSEIAYDGNGNVVLQKDGKGAVTRYRYDAFNNEMFRLDPIFRDYTGMLNQKIVKNRYNGLNELVSSTEMDARAGEQHVVGYEYDQGGNKIREIDENGNVINYYYDSIGNVVMRSLKVTDADGFEKNVSSRYEYDKINRRVAVVDDEGNREYVLYNAFGEVVEKGTGRQETVNETYSQVYYEYDRLGRIIRTNNEGADTVYFYDKNNNLSAEIKSGSIDVSILSGVGKTLRYLPLDSVLSLSGALNKREYIYNSTNLRTGEFSPSVLTANVVDYQVQADDVLFSEPMSGYYISFAKILSKNYTQNGLPIPDYTGVNYSSVPIDALEAIYLLGAIYKTQKYVDTYVFPSETEALVLLEHLPEIKGFELIGAGLSSRRSVRTYVYNAFGEREASIDGYGNETQYVHDKKGNVISTIYPAVDSVSLEGPYPAVDRAVYPEKFHYYDEAGVLVGERNERGNSVYYQYDNAGNLVGEYHADGGEKQYGYDVFGNKRYQEDEINVRTWYEYDKKNQLITVTHPTVFGMYSGEKGKNLYTYDEVGNRITETNSQYALQNAYAKTYYDSKGRVTKSVSYDGRTKRNIYGIQLGTGYEITQTSAFGPIGVVWDSMEIKDHLGRIRYSQDLGGRTYRYLYNEAGLLTKELANTRDDGDLQGEGEQSDLRPQYVGRLKQPFYIPEISTNGYYVPEVIPFHRIEVTKQYEYLNNGKLRYVSQDENVNETYYYDINGNKVMEELNYFGDSRLTVTKYDARNRKTSSSIVGTSSAYVSFGYDLGGNVTMHTSVVFGDGAVKERRSDSYRYDSMDRMYKGKEGKYGNDWDRILYYANGQIKWRSPPRIIHKDGPNVWDQYINERYIYNEVGDIANVIKDNWWSGTHWVARETFERSYDVNGNLIRFFSDERFVEATHDFAYDLDGYQVADIYYKHYEPSQYKADERGTVTTKYDDLGGVVSITQPYVSTNNYYEYWGAAQLKESRRSASWATGFSKSWFDVFGNTEKVRDQLAGVERRFINNAFGRIVEKDEYKDVSGVSVLQEAAHVDYYYVNNDGIEDTGEKIKPYFSVSTSTANSIGGTGSYVVKSGDTLQSIAFAIWGDASLWYLLADANNLELEGELSVNQVLIIPSLVTTPHFSADTVVPYNPLEIIGSQLATLPDPPKPERPSLWKIAVAIIIAAIVVVVVTQLMGPTASFSAYNFVVGLIAGMAGAAAKQIAEKEMGLREHYDYSSIVKSGVVNAVTYGASKGLGEGVDNFIWRQAIDYATNKLVYGDEYHFSWANFAASAVTYAIGATETDLKNNPNLASQKFAMDLSTSMMGGYVGEIVRGFHHDDYQYQWASVTASALGNAIGGALAGKIGASQQKELQQRNSELIKKLVETNTAWDYNEFGEVTPSNYSLYDDDMGSVDGFFYNDVMDDPAELAAYNARLDDPARYIGRDGFRVGPTVERARRMNYYSETPPQLITVKKGQTLSGIAGTSNPTELEKIRLYNNLESTHRINTGQQIYLPSDETMAYLPVDKEVMKADAVRAEANKVNTANRDNKVHDILMGLVTASGMVLNAIQLVKGLAIDTNRDGRFNIFDAFFQTAERGSLNLQQAGVNATRDLESLGDAIWGSIRNINTSIKMVENQTKYSFSRGRYGSNELNEKYFDFSARVEKSIQSGNEKAFSQEMAFVFETLYSGALVSKVLPSGSGVGVPNKIGIPHTRSTNPLSPVREFDAAGNEITYRTMSPGQAKQFELTGRLPPTTETSTAASLEYASGKYTQNGGITFRLTTKPGTSAQLQEIGIAAPGDARVVFPDMSTRNGPWMQTNARFKVEGGQMTTQLGQGRALDIFNENLIDFVRLPKGSQ
ncbi:MAG: putative Ig domain-containing protein [Gammaproteobacteria bacterium]|nr:putative Ig domain-containing protein [Gammaproteobacteria bacterium]